ncbi:single-stranded DNA-binding protein [Helicobacter sp. 14348-15]|uniref:single-stranded DNA-binding protein n=1 Tax=Helicobacter colisuis TaxID=2949739 RepID=UPI00202B7438|nr:single-stranded DNA-binding protein [Helicobacter colisuis]MCL9820608.1 single-stranded DNA-binding protein [Helicobacter colisuis]
MAEINSVVLSGRMAKDVEVVHFKNRLFGNFSLALNETYTDSVSNERKTRVSFFDCVCFGKSTELILEYCKKGDSVVVSGRLILDNSQTPRTKVLVETFKLMHKKQQQPTLEKTY